MESNNLYKCYKVTDLYLNTKYYKIVVQDGETINIEISFAEYNQYIEMNKQVTEHQNKLT